MSGTTGPAKGRAAGLPAPGRCAARDDTLTLETTNTLVDGKVFLGPGSDRVVIDAKPNQTIMFFDSLLGVDVNSPNNVLFFVVGNAICFTADCAVTQVQTLSSGIGPLMTAVDIGINDFARGVSSMIPGLDDPGFALGFGDVSVELRKDNVSVFAAGELIGFSNSATVLSGRGGLRVAF